MCHGVTLENEIDRRTKEIQKFRHKKRWNAKKGSKGGKPVIGELSRHWRIRNGEHTLRHTVVSKCET
jgi:hypothetical protein